MKMMKVTKHFFSTPVKIYAAAAVVAGAGLLIPGNFGLGGHSGNAYAQASSQPTSARQVPKRKRRPAPTLSISVNRRLEEVQLAFDEKNFAKASELLNEIARRRISDYEMAMVFYFRGLLYYEQENFAQAIRSYETVLSNDSLPWSFYDSVIFMVAQLQFAEENYRKSIQLFDQWLVYQVNPPASAFMFKGQAYYGLEDYRSAVGQILIAMEMRKAAGTPVRENTYLLLRSIYFELNDLPKVKEVLETLILNFPPKADYWLQLSAIYSELKEERNQLAAMEVAYKQGYFDRESHFVNLAQLYLYNDVPIKAVIVLEEGFDKKIVKQNEKNLETFSQSLMLAREYKRSLAPLERAAKLSEEGKLYIRLAQVNIELDKHAEAIKAIEAGLKKGDLNRPDTAQTLLGMSYYNIDKLPEAIKAFRAAAKDKRSRKAATQWVNFLRKEIDRRQKLARALRPIKRTISP
jgi:tetratricopeptide (TPR) repeat protein